MRVLLVPEVYRPGDATACGTVNDVATWIQEWLDRDDGLHVYVLMPPREAADYDAAYVHADRERVTLIEAPTLAENLGGDDGSTFTEDGYTAAELSALHEAIYGAGGYVDVVVDQRRSGRFTLSKWLAEHVDQWAASVRPFDVVANVHDLQVPEKYRYCSYRDAFQARMETCGAVFADGIWFSAGVDARRLRECATDVLAPDVVEGALDEAVEIGSPIDFDGFEERYADEPRWLHVAGSFWAKKNAGRVFDVARRLHERLGVRTVLTSMAEIPAGYRDPDWVEAHAGADRETYRRALSRGDLAICASEYETMARTPFEQAASGQVLLLRDAPWIYDCVPDDHPLVADLDGLEELAVAAVERWDEAVAANRRLVEHARNVRSPEAVGRRTYEDLKRRVREKHRRFSSEASDETAGTVQAVEGALEDLGDAFRLDEAVEAATRRAASGARRSSEGRLPTTDVLYALRSLGYRDRGDPGTPTFERAGAPQARSRVGGRTPD